MNDDFPENFSRILFNSSWEMEAIFILIIGICLQNTLRVEKERWAASNIQELDWHSQLDYVTLPVDTVFRTQCQEGVLYPSWIRVARLIIKLTQDRLTGKKKKWTSIHVHGGLLEMGAEKWWSRRWTVFYLPQVTNVLIQLQVCSWWSWAKGYY